MSYTYSNDQILDMFIFETSQQLEQLEQLILNIEQNSKCSEENLNEIFRIMHTIKGSSAMMMFNNISSLAHSMEDLFFFLREQKSKNINYSILSDLIFNGVDFIKVEIEKVKNNDETNGDPVSLIQNIKKFLSLLKQDSPSLLLEEKKDTVMEKQQYYIPHEKISIPEGKNSFKATIFFQEGCEMENIRAYAVIHNLKEMASYCCYLPEDIVDNDDSVFQIREQGFQIFLKTEYSYVQMDEFFNKIIFLEHLEFVQLENDENFPKQELDKKYVMEASPTIIPSLKGNIKKESSEGNLAHPSIISVSVDKLDRLMDLVGEMVIAETMVTQNPELLGLELDNFQKAARQLRKITEEIQDMVMSIRMVPLSTTFHKMNRIMRDMCKKLGKEVELLLIGEETEVDKNIIEHISDPLMHLIRNSIDHGIELPEERTRKGKPSIGTVSLEAKNSGSDVLIIVRDDGKGLNREKILSRARENTLLHRPEDEMSDREIYNLIFLPGFSTNENITEFSGRGVGMDVVVKNIEAVGGTVSVDSEEGKGSVMILKIPLTLAIIDGMNIRVGESRYTIPTTSIIQSFSPKSSDIIMDPDGNKMIMFRGECIRIMALNETYKIKTDITNFTDGIMIMVEQDEKRVCIFADQLLGQQQVVVKSLPGYIKNVKKVQGLAGCTLLGDGSISLILDVAGFINLGQ